MLDDKIPSDVGRSYEWNVRGKPCKISEGAVSEEFRYGFSGGIYQQVIQSGLGDVITIDTIGAALIGSDRQQV